MLQLFYEPEIIPKYLISVADTPGRNISEALGKEKQVSIQSKQKPGLAACALMQGQLEEARKYAEQAWEYLKVYSLEGLENPAVDYRACAEVFDALGEPEMVQVILESGYKALIEAADKITVPEWRQSFLENEPENRALIEIWERRKK